MKNRFIQILCSNIGISEMVEIINMYVIIRKNKSLPRLNLNHEDLPALNYAFEIATSWMLSHFEICILKDKNGAAIRIW